MHSVLLIANGPESARQAEDVLRHENVVIQRTHRAGEADAALAEAPFDAVVCAVDDFKPAARDCVTLVAGVTDTPRVVVLRDWSIPVQSVDISTRVVAIEDGWDELQKAVRQQLRRIPARKQVAPEEPPPTCEFSFSFRAEPSRIRRARAVVGGFLQRSLTIAEADLTQFETVIEEALRNAVTHGSRQWRSGSAGGRLPAEQPERQVSVSLLIDERNVRVTIEDEGPGFDVEATAEGHGSSAVNPVGRGLMMMRAYADSVAFNDIGNAVTLTRSRSAIESDPAGEPCQTRSQAGRQNPATSPSLPEDPSHAR